VGSFVRPADLADVPTIAQLVLEVGPEVIDREPPFRHVPDLGAVERRYASRLRDAERRVFVGILDGSVVGFVDAVLVRGGDAATYHAPGLDVYVEELIVTSSARRRGTGTSLMRAVEAWARDAGGRVVTLDTHASNQDARGLYIALGYREMGVIFAKDL
jgi:ribosomal protein S18 acetylase RimI-like enzyme